VLRRGEQIAPLSREETRVGAGSTDPIGSAARMGKDDNRGDNENYRNDYSAVAINLLRPRGS
jgi:hypothetical protein